MNILLVEDMKSVRVIMECFLKKHGNCNAVENGKKAVEAVEKAIEIKEYYDFICLDIMMPVMDGLEALSLIRKLEKNADVTKSKIIMTTGNYDAQSISEANRNGCDGYFIKPVSPDAIKRKLKEFGLIT